MADVVMYTKTFCPFCIRARHLLAGKGVAFDEINLDREPGRRAEMMARAEGRRTVPQIFINDEGVGGFDEVRALDQQGELDALLAGSGR